MTQAIKQYSGGVPVTIGLHAEDLEEDRRLGPQDAALYCDYQSMHGYPFYLDWVKNPGDVYLVPFLGIIAMWLGQKPVLFQEFGTPCAPADLREQADRNGSSQFWTATSVKDYYARTVDLLRNEGMLGAMAWCYSDYHQSLWARPPLDAAPHERFFGIFAADHAAKPAAGVGSEVKGKQPVPVTDGAEVTARHPWLGGFDRDSFYDSPLKTLQLMFKLYRSTR